MTEETKELLLGLAAFVPLAFIAFQVVMLRRILRSPAWTLLMVGFLVFVAIRGTILILVVGTTAMLVAALVGYGFIAAGFHFLHADLLRVLRDQDGVAYPEVDDA